MRPALVLLLAAAPALAQPAGSQTFAVSGVVVDSVNGRPLSDYSVSTDVNVTWVGNTVVQSAATKPRVSITDEQGRYRLDDLPPGAYRITARSAKGGFGPSDVTRHIELAGQDVDHIDFKIRLPGTIAGRVLDENREPVVGVSMLLISREYYSGVLGYFFKGLTKTDDRGSYIIKRVDAGHPYIVMAQDGGVKLPPRSPAPLDPALRRRAVVPTFYPNSPVKEGATVITVQPGEKREGVDIEVRKSPSYCIEGMTAGLGGPAALMFNLELAQPAFGQSSTGGLYAATPGSTTGPDGKFRVCGLAPGQYRISAVDRYDGPINRALLPFEIVDRDLKNLNLAIGSGITIQGEVVWDGPGPEKLPDAKVSVSLEPLRRSPVANERPYARVDIPGTFTMEGLLPFEYAVRAFVNSPGVYVKDVAYGGHSVLHEPLRAGSAAGDLGLRVSLAHDGATLSATVADKDGNPMPDMRVIVLPANISSEAMLQAVLVSGQSNQTGRYRSQTLRPGKYLVLATDDRIDATPECIDNLWRSRNHFQEVELPPDGTAQVSLTPQPLRK